MYTAMAVRLDDKRVFFFRYKHLCTYVCMCLHVNVRIYSGTVIYEATRFHSEFVSLYFLFVVSLYVSMVIGV